MADRDLRELQAEIERLKAELAELKRGTAARMLRPRACVASSKRARVALMAGASVTIIIPLLAIGCAVGNRHRYDSVTVDINMSSERNVAAATHDQRPYVRLDDKSPTFVGLSRGGYGNPFDVNTASGEALATDMTNSILSSLAAKGFRATAVIVTPEASEKVALEKLQETGAERLLLLTLLEWKSDTFEGTALIYDVSLKVFDQLGSELARKALQGRDDLGGSFWNPPGHAKKVVPSAFAQKLEILFSDSEIERALR
jgi:hypothetical protein